MVSVYRDKVTKRQQRLHKGLRRGNTTAQGSLGTALIRPVLYSLRTVAGTTKVRTVLLVIAAFASFVLVNVKPLCLKIGDNLSGQN